MKRIVLLGSILIYLVNLMYAQQYSVSNSIVFNLEDKLMDAETSKLPVYKNTFEINEDFSAVSAKFQNLVFEQVSKADLALLLGKNLSNEIMLHVNVSYERKKPILYYSFTPYRINPATGNVEKVLHYDIQVELKNNGLKMNESRSYATNSKLQSGNWYKIKVDKTGIFKLTYEQLIQIGLTQPENVRVYSYGGKQLPYANSEKNHDDLKEIPIKVYMGNDNVFNSGDYIIFFAEKPGNWMYDAGRDLFLHQKHHYSNYTYLFISDTEGTGGLRISKVNNEGLSPNTFSDSYDSYTSYEVDEYNLIQSGRTWYGEKFRPSESKMFSFNFLNIISSEPAKIYTSIVGRKEIKDQTCYFKIENDDNQLARIDIDKAYGTYTYAHGYNRYFDLNNPTNNIDLNYTFNGVNSSMEGYLDFICINVREKIKQSGSQLMFRDKRTAGTNNISEFTINNMGVNVTVWNITDPVNPYELLLSTNGNTSAFNIPTDTIEQFISFNRTSYFTPITEGENVGKIENQNYHGLENIDMVILTHPKFRQQANELAEWHQVKDDLKVIVTEPQNVYNEFSSGTPDISAIRNFMRMLYDKAGSEDQMPKYLLLFGDGSYDNLNNKPGNSNYLPTYQSVKSLSETSSYISDDYFGLLDLGEGEINQATSPKIYGLLDLGIGRLPVQTVEEAQLMVNKIKHYNSPTSYGDWRTKICFIGDDEDSKVHQRQPEEISNSIISKDYPEFNVSKIFFDLYEQVSTPAGQRYPGVNLAISRQVDQGALLIDYVGHGNPRILADEEVLSASEVSKWKNWDKLSIFVTASCEVGRFDKYEIRSLGEHMLLNPNGGGIAALTTTRVVYSGGNHTLSKNFFRNVFNTDLSFGDVIKNAKNGMGPSGINHRSFTLLGDPALKIGVPKNKIAITSINNNYLSVNNSNKPMVSTGTDADILYEPGDTISALSIVKVQGIITNKTGEPIYDNGILYITIFDKNKDIKAATQDNRSDTLQIRLQDNVLYKGKASINEGFFEFNFIVPKDINYSFGKGKISLYAALDSSEAIGFSDNIVIGGSSLGIAFDYDEPEVSLYMNDTLFVNGGITNENPVLIAQLKDETGINTTGNGFGHNIVAILDNDQDNIITLNNYYEGDLDKYNSGWVVFPFSDLDVGYHTITLKAWDIYNNSSEAQIEFYVYDDDNIMIEKMFNSPNPFHDETTFTFEHNQSFDAFNISINIFDLMGTKVAEVKRKNVSAGYSIEPVKWNGTSYSGAKLPKGIYIYRTEITTTNGKKANKSSKLIIN